MMSQNLKSILFISCIMLLTAVVSYLFFFMVPSEYTDLILLIAGGVFMIGYVLYQSIWGIQEIVDKRNEEVKKYIKESENTYSEID